MHGFLAIDKASGPSSAAVSHQARNSFPTRVAAGHTGTLDPLATGVLVVAINAATRFIRYLPSAKSYLVELQLGTTTTTYDTEGEVVNQQPVPHDYAKRLPVLLDGFLGKIKQQAPAYSALKHEGKPLYELARAGKEVPVKLRDVEITAIELQGHTSCGKVTLAVDCGPGVYIRSLVHDLGTQLGCGAVMTKLQRTACCGIGVADAIAVPTADSDPVAQLLPTDSLLQHIPATELAADEQLSLEQGKVVAKNFATTGEHRLYDTAGNFLGLGLAEADSLRVARLLPLPQSELAVPS